MPLTYWVYGRTAPSAEALEKVGAQLRRIPAVLRAAGIVHGDLRPDNVLVNARGEVKVIDLGLAAPEGGYNPHLGGYRHGSEQFSSENQRNDGPAAFGDDEFSVAYLLQIVQARLPRH
jgi:serine/threonine protein kinase